MKKTAIAFCVGAAVLLSGCFGGREISKRSFVQIIGVEKDKNIYNVNFQLFKSESSDGNPDVTKANSEAVSGHGTTLSEAMSEAALKTGKELFIGHTKLVVFGDGLNDPSDELEYLYNEKLSPSCPVVYSREPSEIADTLSETGLFSAERIISVMEGYVRSGGAVYTSAAEISEAAEVTNAAYSLPVIYSDGSEVYFSGAVLGDAEGIHGAVSESDIYGAVILADNFPKNGRINVSAEINDIPVSAEIVSADCTRKAFNNDGRLTINADIKLKLKIKDNGHNVDEKGIGSKVCTKVKDAVINAFSAAVWYNGSDIFEISKAVQRDCPELYGTEKWQNGELLRESMLNVKVYGENV